MYYPEEMTFLREANARYDYWVGRRTSFDAAAKLLSTLPDERWVSLEDLAGEYDVDAEALAACLQGTRPDGRHLVLSEDGVAGAGLPLLSAETEAWRLLLERDELFDEARSSLATLAESLHTSSRAAKLPSPTVQLPASWSALRAL